MRGFGARDDRVHLGDAELRELVVAALPAGVHQPTDHLVRRAERHALGHEVLGQRGRVEEAAVEALPDALFVEVRSGDDAGGHLEAVADGVVRGEDLALVLLQVAVVADGQPLAHREQCDEVAVDAAAAPADELEHVRVLLLRHHRRAGGVLAVERDEAELGGGVDDPLLGPAGEPHRGHGQGVDEVEGDVARGGSVYRGVEIDRVIDNAHPASGGFSELFRDT